MNNRNNLNAIDDRENLVVKRDLWFVIGLNLVVVIGLTALYFWNHSTGAVDGFFAQIIKY